MLDANLSGQSVLWPLRLHTDDNDFIMLRKLLTEVAYKLYCNTLDSVY